MEKYLKKLDTLKYLRNRLQEQALDQPTTENIEKLSGLEARIENVEKKIKSQKAVKKIERVKKTKPQFPAPPTTEELERVS